MGDAEASDTSPTKGFLDHSSDVREALVILESRHPVSSNNPVDLLLSLLLNLGVRDHDPNQRLQQGRGRIHTRAEEVTAQISRPWLASVCGKNCGNE